MMAESRCKAKTSPPRDGGVNFKVEEDSKSQDSPLSRHRATVRYNRKAVQKMLAIDEWIDGQLEVLYATSDVPVELCVDDVMKEDAVSEREVYIRTTLEGCPAEASVLDVFVTELMRRISKI
eukprot:scpid80283/ scgid29693/ 